MEDILSDIKEWMIDNPVDYSQLLFDPTINREEALKRNSDFIKCDRCGVVGNRPNMLRWHFDNCKTVLRNCEQCGGIIPRQGTKDYLYNQKKYCNRKCYMASKKGKPFLEMTEEIKSKLSISRKLYYERLKSNKNK